MTRRPPLPEEAAAALRREWRRTTDPATRAQLEEIGRACVVWAETPPAKTRRYRPPRRRR